MYVLQSLSVEDAVLESQVISATVRAYMHNHWESNDQIIGF